MNRLPQLPRTLCVTGALLAHTVLAQTASAMDNYFVNCDQDAVPLQRVINRLDHGGVVEIAGTCTGPVSIVQDNVRLIGTDSAIIQGDGSGQSSFDAVVRISGAQNVVLEGLQVTGGAANGIAVSNGASVALRDVVANRNTIVGLFVDGASVDLKNVSATENRIGIDAVNGARLMLEGDVVTDQNLANGVELNFGGTAELRGARLFSNNNGGFGLVIGSSILAMAGFDETLATGNLIEANDNIVGGILLASSSLEILGTAATGAPPPFVVRAMRNRFGILAPQNATIGADFGTARFELQDNFLFGMMLRNGSSAQIRGGLEISGNGIGLSAAASTVYVQNNSNNPSNISGNAAWDASLSFTTAAVLNAETLINVECDSTVVSDACPP